MKVENVCDLCFEPTKKIIGIRSEKSDFDQSFTRILFSCDRVNCPWRTKNVDDQEVSIHNTKSVTPTGLKEIRLRKGLTISEASLYLGVTPYTYSEWENGQAPVPISIIEFLSLIR